MGFQTIRLNISISSKDFTKLLLEGTRIVAVVDQGELVSLRGVTNHNIYGGGAPVTHKLESILCRSRTGEEEICANLQLTLVGEMYTGPVAYLKYPSDNMSE